MRLTPELREKLKENDISPWVFHTRIHRGWSVERASTTPQISATGREYYIVKNGKLLRTAQGTTAVKNVINKDCAPFKGVSKNMLVGQIYRKGFAFFIIGENKYAAAPIGEDDERIN